MGRVPLPKQPTTAQETNSSPVFRGGAGDNFGLDESGRNNAGTNTVQSRIYASETYKQAYALFSQEEDKIWLQRLEAIVSSAQTANESIWDSMQLSNKSKDKDYAAYQKAMDEIQALISEYQQFRNTLPVTQVDQANDAGVNLALTGGTQASDIAGRTPSATDPSALAGTSGIEMLSLLTSIASNLTGGVLGIFNAGLNFYNSHRGNDRADRELMLSMFDRGVAPSAAYDKKGSAASQMTLSPTWENKLSQESLGYEEALLNRDRVALEKHVFMQECTQDIYKDILRLRLEAEASGHERQLVEDEAGIRRAGYEATVTANLDPETEAVNRTENMKTSTKKAQVDRKLQQAADNLVKKWYKKAFDDDSFIHQMLLLQLYSTSNPVTGLVGDTAGAVRGVSDATVGVSDAAKAVKALKNLF